MAINIKECLLKMQQIYLNQLAAEDNYIIKVVETPGIFAIDFEKNRREVERVIKKL